MKTLIMDIETFPALVYTWGLWDQNIGINQVVDPGGIGCWAAKWAGSEYVEFSSIHLTSKKSMLKEMHTLLDEADEVVGWNSNSFDIKHLNAEFMVHGLTPPSPYKKIDLLRVIKNNAKFLSNKLDFVSQRIGVGAKQEHEGFGLWKKCMDGDEDAWVLMEEYNVQDVMLTEQMYDQLRPWISTSLNRSAIAGSVVCPECGGTHLQSRGYARNTTREYRRWWCRDCGTWSRSVLSEKSSKKDILVKVK